MRCHWRPSKLNKPFNKVFDCVLLDELRIRILSCLRFRLVPRLFYYSNTMKDWLVASSAAYQRIKSGANEQRSECLCWCNVWGGSFTSRRRFRRCNKAGCRSFLISLLLSSVFVVSITLITVPDVPNVSCLNETCDSWSWCNFTWKDDMWTCPLNKQYH